MSRCSRLMAVTLLVAACNGASEPVTDDDTPLEPTPYIVDDEPGDEIDVDLNAIAADLEATLDGIWEINANPVLDAYAAVQVDQTEACPRTYTNQGNVYWFDQCTTDSGTSFSGYGFYYDYYDYPINEVFSGRYRFLNGAARVDTEAGRSLDVAGSAVVMEAEHAEQPAMVYRSELRGTFGWNGPEAAGTWLAEDLAPDLAIQAFVRTDLGGAMLTLDGGLSGTAGASAYVFDQVTVVERALGGPCPQEAFGVISVRNDDGVWIDLLFDGPDPQTFQADPAECDGKGRAYYRGELLGEVEVDFTRLSFDGEAPW